MKPAVAFGWVEKPAHGSLNGDPCNAVILSPRRFGSRHIYSGEPRGASSVRGSFVAAEQCPQAGPPAPLDDFSSDLAACR